VLYAVVLYDFQGATPQQKDLVEQAATVAAQDNMELACAFIQKTAIEKAIPEIDKRLLTVSYSTVPQFFVIVI
jgi:CCR4-NOT transcription complex subunit 1